MTPSLAMILRGTALRSPRALPNLAAWYDIGDTSTLTYDGSNRVSLVADKSGNSDLMAFVSGGAASNTATTATKSITGNQVMTFDVALSDWTPSADHTLFSKLTGFNGIEVLLLTTGVIRVRIGDGAAVTNFDSTVANALTDTTRHTIVITYTDNSSVTFAIDGVALGTSVVVGKVLANGATTATIGTSFAGRIYRVKIGTVYDFNLAGSLRMATSVTDAGSGGGTWTINTSGATGARISGERDLYQGTVASQPVLTLAANGKHYITFDGADDYLKAAPFSLSQPETIYFSGTHVSWTSLDVFFDGGASVDTQLYQRTGSPQLGFAAASTIGNISPSLSQQFLATAVANSTSSQVRLNRLLGVTGDAGTAAAGGFTLGASRSGGNPANITASEVAIYAAAHPSGILDRFAKYASKKWSIA